PPKRAALTALKPAATCGTGKMWVLRWLPTAPCTLLTQRRRISRVVFIAWRRNQSPTNSTTGRVSSRMSWLSVCPALKRVETVHDAGAGRHECASESGIFQVEPTRRTAGHRGRFVCTGTPLLCCPEGTSENSPAFQRWVGRQKVASPEGTAEIQSHNPSLSFGRPFGTCMPCRMFPGVKTPGYSQDVPPGQRNVAAAFSDEQATFVMPKARATLISMVCLLSIFIS